MASRRHSHKTNDRDDDDYNYSDDFISDDEPDPRDRRVPSRKHKSPRRFNNDDDECIIDDNNDDVAHDLEDFDDDQYDEDNLVRVETRVARNDYLQSRQSSRAASRYTHSRQNSRAASAAVRPHLKQQHRNGFEADSFYDNKTHPSIHNERIAEVRENLTCDKVAIKSYQSNDSKKNKNSKVIAKPKRFILTSQKSDHANRSDAVEKQTPSPVKSVYNASRSKSHLKKGKGHQPPSHPDNVTQRMLSAGRIKMNELRNHVEESNIRIRDLLAENKILKKMQFRHEKALNNFENKESNLPQLLTKHANEVRTLKEQLRIAKEKFEKSDRYLRDAEDDLDRAQNKMKKYKHFAEEKGLPERDELSRKLNKMEIDMEEKDLRIKELEKHIEHLNKNHRHELGIEMASHRETKKQLEEFKGESEHLKNKIKEREKELEIKNIYSNRIMRPPHKIPASYSGTPFDTPPPPHSGLRNRVPSLNDLSSRDKAKLYEKKRKDGGKIHREQQKQQQQRKQDTDVAPHTSAAEVDFFRKQRDLLDGDRQTTEKDVIDREERYYKEKERKEREDREWREFEAKRQEQEHEDFRKDEQMKLERQRIKHESEEFEKRQKEERQRRDFEEQKIREREDEIREREMRERIEKEQDNRYKENRERIEREEKDRIEREERDQREREERDRREKEEQRIRDEEGKLKNDIAFQEERMKKDLLLARMKAIDEGIASSGSEKTSPTLSKTYHHTKPTKNLHKGKPANSDVGWLNNSKQTSPDELEKGGYQPSFSSQNGNKDDDKDEQLMQNLFGNLSNSKSKSTTKQNDSSEFFTTSDSGPKKSTSKKQMFPWDKEDHGDPSTKQSESSTRRENSNTMIFGGGAAFLDDDRSSNFDNQKLLPRRPRVPVSTLQSKPSITAVDSIEDEIEEVII